MLMNSTKKDKKIELRINRMRTQLMKNPCCEGEKIVLDGFLTTETTSSVYREPSSNMEKNMEELDKEERHVPQ